MNDSDLEDDALRHATREEIISALFGHMVIQNTNMALMFLGQVPHPQSGEQVHDLEAARMFIDQLEMLEIKTKGNLSREEDKLLQQSLTHLRMTFVEVMESSTQPEVAAEVKDAKAEDPANAVSPESTPRVEEAAEPESRKRYSKRF